MTDHPRLIEYAFPLKQASLDSVHEKNVRHGHISALHIWPARGRWRRDHQRVRNLCRSGGGVA